jgi:hypothetical protein
MNLIVEGAETGANRPAMSNLALMLLRDVASNILSIEGFVDASHEFRTGRMMTDTNPRTSTPLKGNSKAAQNSKWRAKAKAAQALGHPAVDAMAYAYTFFGQLMPAERRKAINGRFNAMNRIATEMNKLGRVLTNHEIETLIRI